MRRWEHYKEAEKLASEAEATVRRLGRSPGPEGSNILRKAQALAAVGDIHARLAGVLPEVEAQANTTNHGGELRAVRDG